MINLKHCECSAGWYMGLFSEVFEKSVTITIVDTMGCVEAEVYNQKHVEDEPYDCQLECDL